MILRIGNKDRPKTKNQRLKTNEKIARGDNFKRLSAPISRYTFLRGDKKLRKAGGRRSWVFSLDKGFTLVEVLLAVVILSIGVVAVLQAYAASLAVLQTAQTTMTSVGLLNQKVGEVQQAVFEKTKIEQAGAEGGFESPFEDFAWTWEIKPTDMEGLHELTVMVTNLLDARAVSVKTYVVGKKEEVGQ